MQRTAFLVSRMRLAAMMVIALAVVGGLSPSFRTSARDKRAKATIATSLRDVCVIPGTDNQFELKAKAQGLLSGDLVIRAGYDKKSRKLIRGDWTLTIPPQNSLDRPTRHGTLRGIISDGEVLIGEGGRVMGVKGVRLKVRGGTSGYASVRHGSGTLDELVSYDNPMKPGGFMSMTFAAKPGREVKMDVSANRHGEEVGANKAYTLTRRAGRRLEPLPAGLSS